MSDDDLKRIYRNLNKLTSLAYPMYKFDTDGYNVEDNFTYTDFINEQNVPFPKVRGVPPLTKFRLGELFGSQKKEVTGFIKSLSYSYPDTSPWEHRRGKRVPKHIVAAITYQVIHDAVPSIFHTFSKFGETFYGINQPEGDGGVGTGDAGSFETQTQD
jgi:hypothetical protein